MNYFNIVPSWFLMHDILFKFLFAIVTLAVSIYSFRVYKICKQKQTKYFGLAFLFFSISYFIQSFLNLAIISKINESICTLAKISSVAIFNSWAMTIHMIFFLTGLITLLYMIGNLENKKMYFALLITSLLSLIISVDAIFWFYLLASVYLTFILHHYINNFKNKKNKKTLIILVAFSLLFLSNIYFIFAINHAIYYIIGNLSELTAYILILVNLILVLKNE